MADAGPRITITSEGFFSLGVGAPGDNGRERSRLAIAPRLAERPARLLRTILISPRPSCTTAECTRSLKPFRV